MTDQNRKTLRSFYCRDYLWDHFEQMTKELGCSMDYLLNESMRLYAQNQDQNLRQTVGFTPGQSGAAAPYQTAPPVLNNRPQTLPPGVDRMNVSPAMEHRTFERMPAVNRNANPQANQPPPPPRAGGATGGWQPVPPPPSAPGFPAEQQGFNPSPQSPIYMIFNNHRYAVDKDKFVIGRGSQQTDLTIRDGNISRKHCAVLYRNGHFYIKDLGSTNGIEYRGNRIESKKIEEGDVFYLCDYELSFTYRP